MSEHAFYVRPDRWSKRPVLEGREAAHARVLRLREGEKVKIMDGLGCVAECGIVKIARKSIELEIECEKLFPAPLARPILALALSKAVRRGFFMEKAEELGCWEIWLWEAEHSQGRLTGAVAEACRQQLAAGMKQSGNPWLCNVKICGKAENVVEWGRSTPYKIMPWERKAGEPPADLAVMGREGETLYVIGPEGGFSDREAELFLQNGFLPVSLGERVLRCETAATVCLALHWWAAQGGRRGNARLVDS